MWGSQSLAFGSESGDLKQLQYLAQIITEEPEKYKELIKTLDPGFKFPAPELRRCITIEVRGQGNGILAGRA